MIERQYKLTLSDKEALQLMIVLTEARYIKGQEFKESMNPNVLEDFHVLNRTRNRLYQVMVDEESQISQN